MSFFSVHKNTDIRNFNLKCNIENFNVSGNNQNSYSTVVIKKKQDSRAQILALPELEQHISLKPQNP